ncbi:RNA recognition motif domain-containing protein [Phthorimaea operculella]|nr:RNA recognition motif domain-containing protein [Phthorimaea operculella]
MMMNNSMDPMMMRQQQMMMTNQPIYITDGVLLPPVPGASMPNRREKPPGCRTIFVGGLPPNVTEATIAEIFQSFGEISDIKLHRQGVGHVRFEKHESVEASFFISGYRFKTMDQTNNEATTLFVDYALNRDDQNEFEKNKRVRQKTPPRIEPFNPSTLTTIGEKIKSDEEFLQAAPTLVAWLERGFCDKRNANQFYSLIQASNNQVRRLFNEKMALDDEFHNMKSSLREKFVKVVDQCNNNQVRRLFNEKLALDDEFHNMKSSLREKFVKVVDQCKDVCGLDVPHDSKCNQFYSLIQASNNQVRRLFNEKMALDDEFHNMKSSLREKFVKVVDQSAPNRASCLTRPRRRHQPSLKQRLRAEKKRERKQAAAAGQIQAVAASHKYTTTASYKHTSAASYKQKHQGKSQPQTSSTGVGGASGWNVPEETRPREQPSTTGSPGTVSLVRGAEELKQTAGYRQYQSKPYTQTSGTGVGGASGWNAAGETRPREQPSTTGGPGTVSLVRGAEELKQTAAQKQQYQGNYTQTIGTGVGGASGWNVAGETRPREQRSTTDYPGTVSLVRDAEELKHTAAQKQYQSKPYTQTSSTGVGGACGWNVPETRPREQPSTSGSPGTVSLVRGAEELKQTASYRQYQSKPYTQTNSTGVGGASGWHVSGETRPREQRSTTGSPGTVSLVRGAEELKQTAAQKQYQSKPYTQTSGTGVGGASGRNVAGETWPREQPSTTSCLGTVSLVRGAEELKQTADQKQYQGKPYTQTSGTGVGGASGWNGPETRPREQPSTTSDPGTVSLVRDAEELKQAADHKQQHQSKPQPQTSGTGVGGASGWNVPETRPREQPSTIGSPGTVSLVRGAEELKHTAGYRQYQSKPQTQTSGSGVGGASGWNVPETRPREQPSTTGSPGTVSLVRGAEELKQKAAKRADKKTRQRLAKQRARMNDERTPEHKQKVDNPQTQPRQSYTEATKQGFAVAITKVNGVLTRESADSILRDIQLKMIRESRTTSSDDNGPVFRGKPSYAEGYLRLWCGNQKTLDWLKNTVSAMTLPSGEKLTVKTQAEISKRTRVGVLIPDPMGIWKDTKDIGHVLAWQNPWAQCERWLVLKAIKQEVGWFLIVSVPNDLVPTLVAKRRCLSCLLGAVYIRFQGPGGKYYETPPEGTMQGSEGLKAADVESTKDSRPKQGSSTTDSNMDETRKPAPEETIKTFEELLEGERVSPKDGVPFV